MDEGLRSELVAAAPAEVGRLDRSEHERWLVHAERLIRRPVWEGARGVELTDEMVATTAAHAALLAAGFEPRTEPFLNVASIVIHGSTIVNRDVRAGPVDVSRASAPEAPELVEPETQLRELLARHRGNLAAVGRDLGTSRSQVRRLLARHGLNADDFRDG